MKKTKVKMTKVELEDDIRIANLIISRYKAIQDLAAQIVKLEPETDDKCPNSVFDSLKLDTLAVILED